MSSDNHQSSSRSHGIDLEAIRDILDQDGVDNLKEVKKADVDWILRDSNIDRPLPTKESGNTSTSTDNGARNNTADDGSSNVPVSPVSPHLLANISNTNENNSNKTRPSMAPIQEESASKSSTIPVSQNSGSSNKRRESVPNINSLGGFFSKLKGKFGHKTQDEPVLSCSLIFKDNYSIGSRKSVSSGADLDDYSTISSKYNNNNDSQSDGLKLSRSMSTPNYSNPASDPRLEEYIKFYQRKDLRRSSATSSSRASEFTAPGDRDKKLSIPEHPKYSPLPSALVNGNQNQGDLNLYEGNSSTGNKFSSFLRRRSSTNPPLPSVSIATEKNRRNSESLGSSLSIPVSTPSPSRSTDVLPEFSDLKPLKRVAFHSLTFLIDPPQQIPSRNPRRGNVEVLPNGALKINPLTEEDKLAIEKSQVGQGGGIVVGGSGSLDTGKSSDAKKAKDEADEYKEASGNNLGKDDDETKVDKHAKLLGIDKPMLSHHNRHNFHNYDIPVKKMALDVMYTRCCHLREILPIPAILKQIPKGSLAPLPVLQLRNPTPTMVEVQTFADFLRIAPILCVSLDGVSLSYEQFKILLSAMSAKTQLEKVSLRNTPIDSAGWSLLCWFLSRNTVLNKLDITQCPSLSVNTSKKKKKSLSSNDKKDETIRMACNKENRSDMDWALFTATIVARGGIEELILTGCCISDLDIFEKFVKMAVLIKTNRLGLAYNNLSVKQLKIVVDNWLFKPFVRGLDIGYNDLLSLQYLNVFLQKRNDKKFENHLRQCSLAFLSLNATNLRFSDAFKEVFETVVMKFPCLKYLDLSNNPKLFGSFSSSPTKEISNIDVPNRSLESSATSTSSSEVSKATTTQSSITSYFTSKFPLFPKLIRLHVENNDLSTQALVAISEVLPFCKNLAYFSIIGNKVDLTAASALTQGLKNSKTLITLDCDYDNIPDFIKEKIGLYSMRNMERVLYASKKQDTPAIHEDPNLTSLTGQLNNILSMKAEQKLDLKSPEVQKFIRKATSIRQELKDAMNELLKLQVKNELNLDGKETFLRFLYIDSSIEKGLQLIDNSLVDSQSKEVNSSYMIRNVSEDEKNTYLLKEDNDSYNNSLDLHKSQKIPISKSPLSLSRSSSKSNLTHLDRQEGSVLKLLRLHDFHHPEDPSESSDIFHSFDNLSGDEIRKRILSVDLGDLDKIIQYLARLKERGISLGNVFNLNDSSERIDNGDEAHLVEEIMGKLKKLNACKDSHEESSTSNSNEETPTEHNPPGNSNPSSDNISNKKNDGVEISQAYDQVLTNLAKLN
ncbi:uncharacterized protein AC631_01133 [Debaryomyces fabryi]|uniref:Uncharacterized protein n=1 Tax=Debaryomyces fabryi TaxID=58627 RepID=A0A0V1Q3Q3_9ASCO|nr:uncharacterized protein AC631_01133 [Debaryomyces fabryi]KSA03120.1 hypothetical protein AC631_01133 [Debaryomyces fabryi]CUM45997.1 unnamed protein product [Debaryomyces fabryi]